MKPGRMNKRQRMLAAALLLTLAATAYVWVNDRKAALAAAMEVAEPAVRLAAAAPSADAGQSPPPALTMLAARDLPEAASDIFAIKKDLEPEPKKVVMLPTAPPAPPPVILPPQPVLPPSPPPAPTVPPLPFTYIGKLGEDGKFTVFLSLRGKNFAARAGDTLAQFYRIDEIRPPMMTLTYLPMNIKQTMQIGEAN